MIPTELNERGLKAAIRLGVDEAIFVSATGNDQMIRFANDSLTVAKKTEESVVSVYLAKNGKRIVGGSTNTDEEGLSAFVERLYKTMVNLSKEPIYAKLPGRPSKLKRAGTFDKRLGDAEKEVSEFASEAIDAAHEAGRPEERRRARSVARLELPPIVERDGGSRHYVEHPPEHPVVHREDASGHGLSCSSSMKGFRPAEAGRRAGEDSKRMLNSKKPEEGVYQILMSPTVAAEPHRPLVGSFAVRILCRLGDVLAR